MRDLGQVYSSGRRMQQLLGKGPHIGRWLEIALILGKFLRHFDDLVADFIPAIGRDLRHRARNRRGAAVLSKRSHDQGKKY